MTEEKKEQFEEAEPVVVPLTPPLSWPQAQPTTEVKGGIDKVTGTSKGMTTETGRFVEN